MITTTPQTLVAAGDGRRADVPGLACRYLVETDGLAVVEHAVPPRTLAAPLHTHRHEDEWTYVLTGRLGVRVGEDELVATPGELVAKPRGVPHAFWNPGSEEARVLELIAPGAFAAYFARLAPLLNVQGPPDFAALAGLQARFGIEMDFDSIASLCSRHGLEC